MKLSPLSNPPSLVPLRKIRGESLGRVSPLLSHLLFIVFSVSFHRALVTRHFRQTTNCQHKKRLIFSHPLSTKQTIEDYFLSTVFFSIVFSTIVVLGHLGFLTLLRLLMDARIRRRHTLDLQAHERYTAYVRAQIFVEYCAK